MMAHRHSIWCLQAAIWSALHPPALPLGSSHVHCPCHRRRSITHYLKDIIEEPTHTALLSGSQVLYVACIEWQCCSHVRCGMQCMYEMCVMLSCANAGLCPRSGEVVGGQARDLQRLVTQERALCMAGAISKSTLLPYESTAVIVMFVQSPAKVRFTARAVQCQNFSHRTAGLLWTERFGNLKHISGQ